MGNEQIPVKEDDNSLPSSPSQSPPLEDQLREDNLPFRDQKSNNPLIKVFHKQILKKSPNSSPILNQPFKNEAKEPCTPERGEQSPAACLGAKQRLFEKGKLRRLENKILQSQEFVASESLLSSQHGNQPVSPRFKSLTISPEKILKMKRARVAEKYDLLQVVGQGSFGVVYKAQCKSTLQLRAVKVVSLDDCTSLQRELFLNEIATLSRLDHPNIIKMYEAIQQGSTYYIVTEYCEGGTLSDYLRECPYAHKEKLARQVMHRLLSALHYLHGQKVLHRDLKLDNIVCIRTQVDGWEDVEIKLIDFGIATAFKEGEDVKSKFIMGTPQYMAPENLERIYTPKSDIWCCGIILHALLKGSSPFKAPTHTQIYAKIRRQSISLRGHEWNTYSKEARDLLGSMLNKKPDSRPTASKALAHPWLAGYTQKHRLQLQAKCINSAKIANNLFRFQRRDNLLTLLDTIILLTKCGQADRERLVPYFRLIDRNYDGVIQHSELQAFFSENGIQTTAQKVEEILHSMDLDKSQTITFSEFLHVVCDFQKYNEQHHLNDLFDALDRNSDGTIDRGELKSSLNGCPEVQLDFLMESMSRPLSRRVSLDEFKHYVRSARQRSSEVVR